MKYLFFLLTVFTMSFTTAEIQRDQEILHYWFGTFEEPLVFPEEKLKLWFWKNPDVDAEIREQFESDLKLAVKGDLNHWKETAKGRLALIILVDQFPRNMYRGDKKMHDFDEFALSLTLEGIQRKHDKGLNVIERLFFYLPLQHAENLDIQNLSLECYSQLVEDAPLHFKERAKGWFDYAKRHHEIIVRFGRFPHRNAILERESTDEEIEFLKTPGSSF